MQKKTIIDLVSRSCQGCKLACAAYFFSRTIKGNIKSRKMKQQKVKESGCNLKNRATDGGNNRMY